LTILRETATAPTRRAVIGMSARSRQTGRPDRRKTPGGLFAAVKIEPGV